MDPIRHALTGFLCIALILAVIAGPNVPPSSAENADTEVRWITKGQGRQFSFPSDVTVDRKGVAFLLDSGNRSIALFSDKGVFVREISGKGVWRDPMGIAVGPDGAIFVADGEGGRVLEIELSGKIRREYPVGRNARVTGVGIYGGSVYCVDNRNAGVVVFNRKGERTASWGKKGDLAGEFNAPFRLAIDSAGRVFVTDVMNARVQWFSPFGKHLGTLKRFGAGGGRIFRPTGIDIDTRGRIWVADSYTGLVQLFEEDGKYVRALEGNGRPFVFGDPVGVAEGPQSVWVADQRDERVALFTK